LLQREGQTNSHVKNLQIQKKETKKEAYMAETNTKLQVFFTILWLLKFIDTKSGSKTCRFKQEAFLI
jgi:hypothetical protein